MNKRNCKYIREMLVLFIIKADISYEISKHENWETYWWFTCDHLEIKMKTDVVNFQISMLSHILRFSAAGWL